MTVIRKLVLTAVTTTTLVTAAAADARPRWGYGGHWRHYGHGGDVAGALIGGLIIGGLIGAAASSAERRRGPRELEASWPEDRAADACAAAVERERGGRVEEISDVTRYRDGWNVTGVIDTPNRSDSFSCSYQFGRVEDVLYGSEYRPAG